jgi:hypothetical protein
MPVIFTADHFWWVDKKHGPYEPDLQLFECAVDDIDKLPPIVWETSGAFKVQEMGLPIHISNPMRTPFT